MKLSNVPVVVGLGAQSLSGDDTMVLEVYVASYTQGGDVAFGWSGWCAIIERELCRIAGGCTRTEGRGAWLNPDTREVQTEAVVVLRSFVGRGQLLAERSSLRQVLVQYGRECEQHTVAFALDGELFGIDPTNSY